MNNYFWSRYKYITIRTFSLIKTDARKIWFIHSVQFSCSVMSNSLLSQEQQHARPPCPSPISGVYPNSCPLSQWYHIIISFSVVPFSSCPQSLPASESFPMSQLFTWGGQSTGGSALASFLLKKSQGWSPWGWSPIPCSPRDSESSGCSKTSILQCSAFFIFQLSHAYMTTGKNNHSFD